MMRRPRCPEHPHNKVWFDGTYGSPGRRRQRYKCVPPPGEGRPHVFTEPLPRLRVHGGDCPECERAYGGNEGPPSVRHFTYTAREVAGALTSVGRGSSYSYAAVEARITAKRALPAFHPQGRPRASRDSAIVEDWIEVFAPMLLETRLPSEWPEVLLLDDLPFRVRSRWSKSGSIVAWRVFGAVAADGSVFRLEGYPDKTPASWERFLVALDGRPQLIVSDNESGMLKGIELAWGKRPYESPVVWLCHWHLRFALAKLLHRYGAPAPLRLALERAFQKRSDWERFLRFSTRYRVPALQRWLDQPDPCWWVGQCTRRERVEWQLENRSGTYPTTIGAMEGKFTWLRDQVDQRKFAFRNRPRTNLMLGLMQAHLNHLDNAQEYAQEIRRHALSLGGRSLPRGLITDPSGYRSLW